MFTHDDIEILESILEDLKTARGSDFSGVEVLEKAIHYLTANIQGTSTISVNINSRIKVKLTEYGVNVYKRYMIANLPLSLSKRYFDIDYKPNVDENGYSRFLLWEFMSIYGDELYIGNMDNVIDPLKIYIENGGGGEGMNA